MSRSSYELDGVRWDKVRVLGKGSFGEAVLVRRNGGDPERPDFAVCKRVVLSNMKPEERREAVNEVNVLRRLRHPNIVEYLGSFEKDDTLHIFMEYANSGDIEALIKAQKTKGELFDEALIASLVLQMASAIKYLHERRILHRDLKAQNVFLSRRRPGGPLLVKLGDFGISTVLRNTHALAKTVCGTPYYFSPELCLNKPYNNKTDIWSLGCIVYEIATLRHAFDAQNMKALVARILKGNYTPVSSKFGGDLQRLIDQMLQQKADRRLDIDGVLGSSWMRRHAAILATNDMMRTITSNIRIPGLGDSKAAVAAGPSNSSAQPVAKPRTSPNSVRPTSSEPRRTPAGSAAVAVAAARRDPRPVVPGNLADDGRKRQALAQERREALEAMEAERRKALDERRKQRDKRVQQRQQQHQNARRQQLEDLDEIRRRMELQTYEEQQRYVEKGWDELERVGNVQDTREQQAKQREAHLDMLKQQMAEIEGKMNARRAAREATEAALDRARPQPALPAIGGREDLHRPLHGNAPGAAPAERVPAGFTPESWRIHQQRMGAHAQARPDAARPRPGAPEPPLAVALQAHRAQQQRSGDMSKLDEFDVDKILATRRAAREEAAKQQPPEPSDPTRALWEQQRQRIEAARAAEPTAGELAWREQEARLREARERQEAEERAAAEAAAAAAAAAQAPTRRSPSAEDAEFDDVIAFVNEVQNMAPETAGDDDEDDEDAERDPKAQREGRGPDGDVQFSEAPLPANVVTRMTATVKFTLDGKTLHLKGASQDDPLTHRVEALRVFLTESLGGDREFEDLHAALEYIQNCDADDDEADRMLAELEHAYGARAKFVDLMVQYMVCVSMLAA